MSRRASDSEPGRRHSAQAQGGAFLPRWSTSAEGRRFRGAPLPRPDPQRASAQPGFRRAREGARQSSNLQVADEPVVPRKRSPAWAVLARPRRRSLMRTATSPAPPRLVVQGRAAGQLAADYSGMAEPLGLPEMADQPKQVEPCAGCWRAWKVGCSSSTTWRTRPRCSGTTSLAGVTGGCS